MQWSLKPQDAETINMMTGTSQAGCAVLTVGAGVGELQAGEGHLWACPSGSHTGCQTTVSVNELASTEPPCSQKRCKKVIKVVSTYVKKTGGRKERREGGREKGREKGSTTTLPQQHLCQFLGGMVTTCWSQVLTCLSSRDRNIHKDGNASGTTLFEALNCILLQLQLTSPWNLLLQDRHKIGGTGTIPMETCFQTLHGGHFCFSQLCDWNKVC